MHPFFNYIDKTWPLAASVLAGSFAFGSLHSDVAELKAAQTIEQRDHDTIMHLDQGQADMKIDLEEIKKTLSRIENK